MNLPVERYPDIAPPRITVATTYTGASAETVEERDPGAGTAN